jgi:uncharacterized 2Fe-2S/4Fe-4S cluster protein (DUF4445 family)
VDIDGSGVRLETIGNAEPVGICGTALTMAIAAMLENGILDETGAYAEPEALAPVHRDRLFDHGGQAAFALDQQRSVYITQKDVRELQLAKGAIRTAIESLLASTGSRAEDLDRLHLAGNFGAGMSVTAEMRIGMLPSVSLDRVDSVGNAALRGAARALLSRRSREDAEQVAHDCQFLELAGSPEFQMRFAEAMLF